MNTTVNQVCGSGSDAVSRVEVVVWLAVVIFFCSLIAPGSSHSEEFRLHSLSLRARVSGLTTLGAQSTEKFQEYDLTANLGLPWERYSETGWGVGTRLMTSVGILRGAGENALAVSMIPGFALGSEDGRFALDLGAGIALLSRSRFGTQDFGGPFQFALTIGVGIPLYKQLGVGYRFLHYSDAGVNGPDTIGADFHMVEFLYRF